MIVSPALRYFHEAVRCGSIRLAAERLRIAPSAISRHISLLEHDLDARLLIRNSHGVVATTQGELLADYVSKLEKNADTLRSQLDDLSALRRGHVRIAAVEAMTTRILPESLLLLRKHFPGITAAISIAGTNEVAEAVSRHEVDIGLALDLPFESELRLRMRWPQPLQAIVGRDHKISSQLEISLCELVEFPYALPDRTFGIRMLIEKVAANERISLAPLIETNSLEVLRRLAADGEIATVLPPEAVLPAVDSARLAAVPLQNKELSGATIDVFTSKDRILSKAAETVLDAIRQSVGRHRSNHDWTPPQLIVGDEDTE